MYSRRGFGDGVSCRDMELFFIYRASDFLGLLYGGGDIVRRTGSVFEGCFTDFTGEGVIFPFVIADVPFRHCGHRGS